MVAKLEDWGLELVEKEKAPGSEGDEFDARFDWLDELSPPDELLPELAPREWLIAFRAHCNRSWKSMYAGMSFRRTGVSKCEK